jgi:hypothetical protein
VKGEHGGRIVADGPYGNRDEAFRNGVEMFDGDTSMFSVEPLITRDKGEAMAHFKHNRIIETHDLDIGLRRGIRNFRRKK